MVKATDFWECLCNKLNYRFFSGIPCIGLDSLYNKMSSEFMHYIPAVSIQIAVGLTNGAFLAGVKSAVLLETSHICKLDLDFNLKSSIPLLLIASGKEKPSLRKEIYILDLTDNLEICLDRISKHLETKLKPGVLFIEEEMLL
jgi:sulfopyruvate decarboxylase TPP-binding subunit